MKKTVVTYFSFSREDLLAVLGRFQRGYPFENEGVTISLEKEDDTIIVLDSEMLLTVMVKEEE